MKFKSRSVLLLLVFLLLIPLSGHASAQDDNTLNNIQTDTTLDLPATYLMTGFRYEGQLWNNCGPATLTMALSYFGYQDDQNRAASWLKPNGEDKNVSPWQMVSFVNNHVPEIPVYSMIRYGGTLDTLRTLVANNFPVIIEEGYDPERANQGWMGHYLLIIGYDDTTQTFMTHDSYDGESLNYSYEHIAHHWQHFNYTYMPLYLQNREAELLELLGDDADPLTNIVNAYNIALEEATADGIDAFAFHNLGSNLVMLARDYGQEDLWTQAVVAFDNARNLGLPWRMLWYQFGMYEAYNATGDFQTTIDLAQSKLNDGGGQYVEETFYYAGIAREGLGETQRALNNYNEALNFNPNFAPAREARDALQNAG